MKIMLKGALVLIATSANQAFAALPAIVAACCECGAACCLTGCCC